MLVVMSNDYHSNTTKHQHLSFLPINNPHQTVAENIRVHASSWIISTFTCPVPVRPGAPRNLHLAGVAYNELELSYEIPRSMKHFPPGLIQDVQFRNQWEEHWTSVDTSDWDIKVNRLKYEHKTKVDSVQLGCLLNSLIFVIRKAAAPKKWGRISFVILNVV